MRWMSSFLLMIALAFAGCSSDASVSDNWVPLDYESNPHSAKYDFSAVDSAAERFIASSPAIRGLTLAVVREDQGQIYEMGYGEFERDRTILVASAGKLLAAGVIVALADDGLLELDRPVAEYLDWGDHHPAVTIENLLSMMSGIEGWPEDNHPCVHDPTTTVQACGRTVFQNESESVPPGEEYRYSGTAWQLAGAVAEVVSGKSWVDLVDEKLVQPCGLPNTGFLSTDSQLPYPAAFDGDPASWPPSDNPEIGGGAYITVNDYSKVLLMHLHDGRCGEQRVLSSEMVQHMQKDLTPEGVTFPPWTFSPAVSYGLGWFRYEDDPELLIDPGAWGAKAVLHPGEGWAAILLLENNFTVGNTMLVEIVPLIREAILQAE
jgi:CubicO group peptidase (beta-lactamase class C family)